MLFPRVKQERQDIAGHYNELDLLYRKLWGEHLHHGFWQSGNETLEEAVLKLVDFVAEKIIKPDDRVCDIGCGYGGTARRLAQKWNAIVTGLTISEKQYAYAQKLNGGPTYLLTDFLENDFPKNSFDAALSIECSEHMPDKERFFSECYRILRPGGRIAVCAWLGKERPNGLENRYLLEPICREARLPSLCTSREYCKMMGKAHFSKVSYTDLTDKVKKTWSTAFLRIIKAFFQNSDFRSHLFDPSAKNRSFLKTIIRMQIAYNTGTMSYGLFLGEK